MRKSLKLAAIATLLVAPFPALAATPQAESFDSAPTAAVNGWTLYNGEVGWGWSGTNYAGGKQGEARAATITAGTQRWYADVDLGGDSTFTEDWQASGRMDFAANSASDGGMFFGFFNRDTSLAANTQTVAGFLLVNGQLTLRFERRPNTSYIETTDFGLWVNEDHTFVLSYDADGAGPGVGRLTASLTSLADLTTVTKSIDISHDLVAGARLNSFGYYAMDFASGRYTPFEWAIDDLTYGPKTGDWTWLGSELLTEPRASFPTVTPSVNATSIVLGAGAPNDKLLDIALVPAGHCASDAPSCTVQAHFNLTRLQNDSDPYLVLSDGSQLIGAVIFDDLGGGAGIVTGNDLGASFQPTSNVTVLSGLGYPAVGQSVEVDMLFDLRPTESLVTISMPGGSATRSLAGFDRTGQLRLVLGRDNESDEKHQVNSVSASVGPEPISLLDMSLSSSVVAGCKSVTGKVALSAPAPAGGVVVQLGDTLSSAAFPTSVTVVAGTTTRTFTGRTVPVAVLEAGRVGATLGGTTMIRDFSVRPMGLTSVTLTPSTVVGSNPVVGKATLECKAGPGPITVHLSSTNAAVASPVAPSVVISQSLQSANFDVTTNAVPAKSYATIAGTANDITKSKKLTITPAAVVSPTSLKFGNQVLNTSVTKTLALSNMGAIPYSVTGISLAGSSPQFYAQTHDCPATLAPGAYCTIGVTFTPTVAAYRSAYLVIATSATSVPIKVLLAGTGVVAP